MKVVESLLDSGSNAPTKCPHCGAATVQHSFFAGPDLLGWGAVWCETCKHGVHLSRVTFPAGLETNPMGSNVPVPSFTIIKPP